MRSVMNIKNQLIRLSSIPDYDILTFTETWLTSNHHNNEFLSNNYKVFRKDRFDSNIEAERGGGVLIAVLNEIDCEHFLIPEMTDLEAVCVKFPLSRGNLFVYCLYVQPDSKLHDYEAHIKAIHGISLTTDDILMVAGDFNLPMIKWIDSDSGLDFIPLIGESRSAKAMLAKFVTDSLTEYGLFQLNNATNKSGNVLDMVYSNVPELTSVSVATRRLIKTSSSDKAHNPLSITLECEPSVYHTEKPSNTLYSFRRANYDSIREDFATMDFHSFLPDSVDVLLDKLYNKIYDVIDRHVPKSSVKNHNNHPKWFTKEVCNLKNIRNRLYKKLCSSRTDNPDADTTKFNKANELFESTHKNAFDDYMDNISMSFRTDPKQFWNHVNGKRKSNSLPCKMHFNGTTASNDQEKAELFAEFFSSVYVEHPADDSINEFIRMRNDNNCFNIHITPDTVFNVLKSLDLNKGLSPDGISPLFLRECAEYLAYPLCLIFNHSIKSGIYPDAFKVGRVTPIFKSGGKADITNYRGVSIMKNLAKIFEKVVYFQLKLILAPKLSK